MIQKVKNNHQPCGHCGQKYGSKWEHPIYFWEVICSKCLSTLKSKKKHQEIQ